MEGNFHFFPQSCLDVDVCDIMTMLSQNELDLKKNCPYVTMIMLA
jgi:hypothetical protein